MKKHIFLFIVALMGIQICHAQYTEKKAVVALSTFSGKYATELRNAVMTASAKARLAVTLLDWEEVKNDPTLSASVDFLISGSTGEITTKETRTKESTSYTSSLPFSLTMMKASTGQVLDSRSTDRKGYSSSSRQASIDDCAKLESSVIEEYNALIYKNCAIRVPIQVIQDVKKGKVETVIIDGGSDIGICDGLTFDVQMESDIAGKKIYKTIGEAKVKDILSGELTLCQITKGSKEITKMLDDDVMVVLTSNSKSSFGEALRGLGNTLLH